MAHEHVYGICENKCMVEVEHKYKTVKEIDVASAHVSGEYTLMLVNGYNTVYDQILCFKNSYTKGTPINIKLNNGGGPALKKILVECISDGDCYILNTDSNVTLKTKASINDGNRVWVKFTLLKE